MVTSTTTVDKEFTTDGVTTSISYPYKFFAKTDLVIKEYNSTTGALIETKVLDTDYTIPGTSDEDGYPSGATITIIESPVPNGTRWVIQTNIPRTQDTNYPSSGPFPHTATEQGLDKLALKIQEILFKLSRTPQVNRSATTASLSALELPKPVDGSALLWSGTAGKIVNSSFDLSDIENAIADAAASAVAAAASAAAAVVSAAAALASQIAAAASAVTAAAQAVIATTQATASAASAASASAISAGSIAGFASVSGTVTAIDKAAYWVDDGASINLPAIGTDVAFRYMCKTQPPVTGITLKYTSNSIQGISGDVLLKTSGCVGVFSQNGSTWLAVAERSPLVYTASSPTARILTASGAVLASDDLIVCNSATDIVLTMFNPALSTKEITIKNIGAGRVSIARYGSETIDGVAATWTYIYQLDSKKIRTYDSANWILI